MYITQKVEKYIWSKVDKTPGLGPHGDCWEWRGNIDNKKGGSGYGRIRINNFLWRAHRLIFTLTKEDPGNLFILHSCDNRICVNPSHLNAGTNYDNVQDKVNKGRQLSGSKNSYSKLSENDVKEIRRLANKEGISVPEIAKLFNISIPRLYEIVRNKAWTHVKTPWDLRLKPPKPKELPNLNDKDYFKYWSKIIIVGDCWEWMGGKSPQGYGIFCKGQGKSFMAHRISYQIHKGPIPEEMLIRHLCGNKACLNPDHLKAGTDLENAQDKKIHGTQPQGENIKNAKLTEYQVLEIRELAKTIKTGILAKQYSVHPDTIRKIKYKYNWKHI